MATQQNDPYKEEHGLDEAKKKLSEMHGRPFDVDHVLAQHRAKQDRERDVRKEAEAKLESARKEARERRHAIQVAEKEKKTQAALEKEFEFQEKNLDFAKREAKGRQKGTDKPGNV
jgi:predicted phage gp36 major capsid-like protein